VNYQGTLLKNYTLTEEMSTFLGGCPTFLFPGKALREMSTRALKIYGSGMDFSCNTFSVQLKVLLQQSMHEITIINLIVISKTEQQKMPKVSIPPWRNFIMRKIFKLHYPNIQQCAPK